MNKKSRIIFVWGLSDAQRKGLTEGSAEAGDLSGSFHNLEKLTPSVYVGRVRDEVDLELTKEQLNKSAYEYIDLEPNWRFIEVKGFLTVEDIQAAFEWNTLQKIFIRTLVEAKLPGGPSDPESPDNGLHPGTFLIAIYDTNGLGEESLKNLTDLHGWMIVSDRCGKEFHEFFDKSVVCGEEDLTTKEKELIIANAVTSRQIKVRSAPKPKHPERLYDSQALLNLKEALSKSGGLNSGNLFQNVFKIENRLLPHNFRKSELGRHHNFGGQPSYHAPRHSTGQVPTSDQVRVIADSAFNDAKKREASVTTGQLDNLFGVAAITHLSGGSLNPSAPEFHPTLDGSPSTDKYDELTLSQCRIVKLLKHCGPAGIRLSNLTAEYERRFGLKLNIHSLGYKTINDFLGTLTPAVAIEFMDDPNTAPMSPELKQLRLTLGLPIIPEPIPVVKLFPKAIPAEQRFFQLLLIFLIAEVTHYNPKNLPESSLPGIKLSQIPTEWKRKYTNVYDLGLVQAHCGIPEFEAFIETIPEIQVVKSVGDLRVRIIPGSDLPPPPSSLHSPSSYPSVVPIPQEADSYYSFRQTSNAVPGYPEGNSFYGSNYMNHYTYSPSHNPPYTPLYKYKFMHEVSPPNTTARFGWL